MSAIMRGFPGRVFDDLRPSLVPVGGRKGKSRLRIATFRTGTGPAGCLRDEDGPADRLRFRRCCPSRSGPSYVEEARLTLLTTKLTTVKKKNPRTRLTKRLWSGQYQAMPARSGTPENRSFPLTRSGNRYLLRYLNTRSCPG